MIKCDKCGSWAYAGIWNTKENKVLCNNCRFPETSTVSVDPIEPPLGYINDLHKDEVNLEYDLIGTTFREHVREN